MFRKKIFVLAFSMLLFASIAFAQSGDDTGDKKIPLNPDVTHGQLANGVTYYIQEHSEPESRAELRLIIKAGSILETDDQQGLAHFVEHMTFNGTKHFKENELINFLENSGVRFGAHINAYTSFDETVYKLSLPTDSAKVFSKGFQILEDWAHNVSFDPEEVDKERGVVIEEHRQGLGAQQRIREKTLPTLLHNSRYPERLPIGELDVIKNFDYDQLTSFYAKWYRPELMGVVAVGDFEEEEVREKIEKHFSRIEASSENKGRDYYSVSSHEETLVSIATDKEVQSTRLEIHHKKPKLIVDTEKRYIENIKRSLYNRMINNRINEISLEPDAPFLSARSNFAHLLGDTDTYRISVIPKEGELKEALEMILRENVRVQRYGFIEEELKRSKKSLLERYENRYNERSKRENASIAEEYINHFLSDEAAPGLEFEYNLVRNHIDDITLNEINSMTEDLITEENRVVLLTAPEDKKEELPTEDELRSVVQESASMNVTPYEEEMNDEVLLDKVFSPREIVSEEKIGSVGVTKLILENNVKILLKHTDFKNNQILFQAASPGGSSLYSDEDYLEASNAATIISRSGVADFKESALKKKLSDKSVSLSPYISKYSEGIRGSASTDDLQTLFELIHLYFSSPRFDEKVVQSWQDFQINYLKGKYNSPDAVYEDTLRNIMNNYSERYAPLEVGDIKDFDFDRMQDIYRGRFEDASDFAFTFTGNFNVDSLRSMAKRYLGNLPGGNQNEDWRNLEIGPPAGPVDKEVYEGLESKSRVNIILSGETSYSPSAELQLDALGEILNIKLREVLREQEGGVYGVGVRAGIYRIPDDFYNLQISFRCDPENADRLIEMVYNELEKMKNDGPAKEYLDKVITIKKRERETKIKENEYWRDLLVESYLLGEDLRKLHGSFEKEIDSLTPEHIQAISDKFIREDNRVKVILYPEKAQSSE